MVYSILTHLTGTWTKVKSRIPDAKIYIRGLIDCVINLIYGLYYYRDDVPHKMTPVLEPYIMESAVSLAEKIRNKEVTSEEVVRAYCARIDSVNALVNAVVDRRYAEAVEEARGVDTLLATDALSADELKNKPFLGVPFTTKEGNQCRGMKHTLGLVSRKDVRATEDADVIRLMKEAGAILIATTNVPELCFWMETGNNVYGQTNNPYNFTRNVGGSTGGEAAILTSAGSPMGIGSDLGGSIRIPAFYCGIFGHKPTYGLTPLKGITLMTGDDGPTVSCVGPMSRFAEDLAPMLKVIVGENVVKLPKIDDEVSLEDLRVFYMPERCDVTTSPVSTDLRSAMDRVVVHMSTRSRHPVKKLDIENMKHSFRLSRYRLKKVADSKPSWATEMANRKGKVSMWNEVFKTATRRSEFTFASILKLIDSEVSPKQTDEWAKEALESLRKELVDKLGDNGVLIYPSSSFPASSHHSYYFRYNSCAYATIFSVLKLPATQVPLGLNKSGLPVGVQVVAGPYQDHLCIAVAKELERAFGGWVPPFKT